MMPNYHQHGMRDFFSMNAFRCIHMPFMSFLITYKFPFAATPQRSSVIASAFVVEAKQNSLRRQRTTEKARLYNKSHKSEIATRMKKVLQALAAFKAAPPSSEADLAPVGTLLSEAYQVLDKAQVKGILHRNTVARRKARLARARQQVLIQAGLYTPQK